MGGTMKDVNGILPKIQAGIYKLENRRKGKSGIWNLFAEIKRIDESLVEGFLCCRKCMSLHKFDGKHTSNLNRHRCYKLLMNNDTNNDTNVKRFFEMMDGSDDKDIKQFKPLAFNKFKNDVENDTEAQNNAEYFGDDMTDCNDNEEVEGGEDTKGGMKFVEYADETYEEYDYDDMGDRLEQTTEDVKMRNPLDLLPQPDDTTQHCETTTAKLRKSSYKPYTIPTRVDRNMKQLNSLCEMIKSDLHDAPDDLFFVAKWKIMDILRDVQSKRLERQSTDARDNALSSSKDV